MAGKNVAIYVIASAVAVIALYLLYTSIQRKRTETEKMKEQISDLEDRKPVTVYKYGGYGYPYGGYPYGYGGYGYGYPRFMRRRFHGGRRHHGGHHSHHP
jgi:hypothetical protein